MAMDNRKEETHCAARPFRAVRVNMSSGKASGTVVNQVKAAQSMSS